MTRGGSSAQRVCVAGRDGVGTRGGEPCAAHARERERRVREGAVGVNVSGLSGGGCGGGELLLRRAVRECVWCRRGR